MRHQERDLLDLERCIFTSALEETWCPNLEAVKIVANRCANCPALGALLGATSSSAGT